MTDSEDTDKVETASSSRRRTIAVILFVILAVAVAIGVWILSQPVVPPAGEPSRAPVAEAPRAETPPAVTPAPEPAPAPPTTPRRARPKPAAPPEPAPPPAPTTGTLSIDSDVAGAMVFLDREYKGSTPVVIEGVTPGTHRLNLSVEGYEGYSETVDVAVGPMSVTVRFREVKLDEAIKVVHKHTVGSCQGRLVADPQGLRYETSNKNDAFALKFADLETFEIDYLEKNLRIKQRGGRTYNFTAESADTLFVFHKNVQQARERLAKGDPPAPGRQP